MENDLISRQKLIYDLEAWRNRLDRRVSLFDDMVIHALPAVFDLVNEQDAIEAEPVRHGRWDEVWCFDYMDYTHFCSECHYDALTKEGTMHDEVLTTYCPSCGCKMDGGAEDG